MPGRLENGCGVSRRLSGCRQPRKKTRRPRPSAPAAEPTFWPFGAVEHVGMRKLRLRPRSFVEEATKNPLEGQFMPRPDDGFDRPAQPGLSDLLAGYLRQQVSRQAAGLTAADSLGEV